MLIGKDGGKVADIFKAGVARIFSGGAHNGLHCYIVTQ